MRKKENWLYDIQKGVGRDIARAFFLTYFTQEEITKQLYSKAYNQRKYKNKEGAYDIRKKKAREHFVMPSITKRYKEWNKLNFFDRSRPIPIKYKPKGFTLPILNLEPLYRYFKEKYNIEFNEKETAFINFILSPNIMMRWFILLEYPNEDIINATLKFYVKHYPIPYGELHREKKRLPNKEYVELLKRAERDAKKVTSLNIKEIKEKPELAKKYLDDLEKKEKIAKKNFTLKDLEKLKKNLVKTILYAGAYYYMTCYKKNPQFVTNVDRKFMKALGILP